MTCLRKNTSYWIDSCSVCIMKCEQWVWHLKYTGTAQLTLSLRLEIRKAPDPDGLVPLSESSKSRIQCLQACHPDICGHEMRVRDWCEPTWRISQADCWTTCSLPLANRSVDDAVSIGLHYILQHLDSPGTYVRIPFMNFSLAFNTIISEILFSSLFQPPPVSRSQTSWQPEAPVTSSTALHWDTLIMVHTGRN